MIQNKEHLPQEWFDFIEQIKILNPIDEETVKQFVKVRVSQFPSDQQMREYYEEVFSKSTNDSSRKKWHQQDKILLIWCVTKYLMSQNRSDLIPNNGDWEYISKILCVDKQLVELKWLSLLHSNLKISTWTKEEDQILTDIASQHYSKNNWTELTIKFNQLSQTQRYPKQIRERWNNVLNPSISKQTWTKEEKIKLIQLILEYGKKWSKIQNQMNSRSENQIKNQYNGIIRNLKRFNVQPSEERLLLKAIAENPDQKLNLTVTQFMSDFLAKKDASKRVDTPLLNNRKMEGANLKKTQVEIPPLDNPLSTSNLSQIEKSKISQESQHQIPLNPNLYQLQNSNLSIPQVQQQQMYYGNQYYMNSFPNPYMNYAPINQAYPNYYQFPLSSGFQQYPGYF
ncbi:unnamed protein product (macronuclear) [Paramecium tetraurelia]|uniref:Uncharacterized protein n=1 Tax=Paramecium tetraurelia TaxID=5888 RepID=A0EE71_PARTE|nr:uncharacterized protein GSPATT00025932001 [Paramecium tetraurelia]CAK93588.1 unnamed protein product [Paramecium tetraurelia]|eukprot:XP_001460985.1 hypothetical protein (macronuclear) [Paramecium tetraurelia strain d4-2]